MTAFFWPGVNTDNKVLRYRYIPRALLSVRTGPLYWCKEVAQARASISVYCTDIEM